MSRMIKFRAWLEGKMINRGLHDRNWYTFGDKLVKGTHPSDNYLKTMQFTGLKDKNGIEIYEGDILEGTAPTGIVKFGEFDNKKDYADNDIGVGFYIERSSMGIASLSRLVLDVYEYEVIGNIHQNPELLK